MRLLLALSLLSGCSMIAYGQTPQPVPLQMPGQEVGKPLLKQVGTAPPTIGQQQGTLVNGKTSLQNLPSALTTPPDGQKIDLSNVIAPYPGMPKNDNFWTKLEDRWAKLLSSSSTANTKPTWTPAMSRRTRDRREQERRMRD